MREPPFRAIKGHIAGGIATGRWGVGDILPSEHALCRTFQVSRVTVGRAMRELANENVVRRVPGVGTFVAQPGLSPEAQPQAQSELVEIRSIAQEIFSRGHAHAARVLSLETLRVCEDLARLFGVASGGTVFRSVIVHLEAGVPLQVEDRLVCPLAAPGYIDQDFSQCTPNEYLSRVAPLGQAEHLVQAIVAPADVAALLALGDGEPCLLVTRRTWSGTMPVSRALLYHPGNRFRLGGRLGDA